MIPNTTFLGREDFTNMPKPRAPVNVKFTSRLKVAEEAKGLVPEVVFLFR